METRVLFRGPSVRAEGRTETSRSLKATAPSAPVGILPRGPTTKIAPKSPRLGKGLLRPAPSP